MADQTSNPSDPRNPAPGASNPADPRNPDPGNTGPGSTSENVADPSRAERERMAAATDRAPSRSYRGDTDRGGSGDEGRDSVLRLLKVMQHHAACSIGANGQCSCDVGPAAEAVRRHAGITDEDMKKPTPPLPPPEPK